MPKDIRRMPKTPIPSFHPRLTVRQVTEWIALPGRLAALQTEINVRWRPKSDELSPDRHNA
jgi:hypothetical protein